MKRREKRKNGESSLREKKRNTGEPKERAKTEDRRARRRVERGQR